ncbi:MAG: type II toxin-antitoxin system Phd/YefM family antitoxin [Burkholderiaceae bacterium]|nr:type II toxin-antitoxin system Phd/YefM family antitoxin [Burkholderiaceae bacterium]
MPRFLLKGPSARRDAKGPSARRWQLQTAKAQFSELFRRARSEGPQWVTRQDKEAVVVLPAEEFERLRARSRQPQSLVEFFAKSPLRGVRIDLDRKPDYGRAVEL